MRVWVVIVGLLIASIAVMSVVVYAPSTCICKLPSEQFFQIKGRGIHCRSVSEFQIDEKKLPIQCERNPNK